MIGARKMESVITDIQEHSENLGAADHGQEPSGMAEFVPGLCECSACRIPQYRFGIVRMPREIADAARHDQTQAACGVRAAFMRMAAVHHRVGLIERAVKELLVALDF